MHFTHRHSADWTNFEQIANCSDVFKYDGVVFEI